MVLSWTAFYLLHSALASSKIKRFSKAKWPRFHKNYRLFYTLLSSLLLLGIFAQALFLPAQVLFQTMGILSYLGYMIATLGVVVFSRAMKEIRVWDFLTVEEKDTEELIVGGIYQRIRHPFYLALLLIFGGYFLVAGTLGALLHFSCLVLYLPFGIYFEEKNLLRQFGEKYQAYREAVPALFPRLF